MLPGHLKYNLKLYLPATIKCSVEPLTHILKRFRGQETHFFNCRCAPFSAYFFNDLEFSVILQPFLYKPRSTRARIFQCLTKKKLPQNNYRATISKPLGEVLQTVCITKALLLEFTKYMVTAVGSGSLEKPMHVLISSRPLTQTLSPWTKSWLIFASCCYNK